MLGLICSAWRSQRRGPRFEGRYHFIRYMKRDLDAFMAGYADTKRPEWDGGPPGEDGEGRWKRDPETEIAVEVDPPNHAANLAS